MSNPIEDNATKILIALFTKEQKSGIPGLIFKGPEISDLTGSDYAAVNDAVDYLHDRGLIDRLSWKGTKPYNFGQVSLNSRGRFLYHELQPAEVETKSPQTLWLWLFLSVVFVSAFR